MRSGPFDNVEEELYLEKLQKERQQRQLKWDRRWLRRAYEISKWSKDPSTQVGAVIVNSLGQSVGEGYNGFPRGVNDTDERYLNRDSKYKFIVHAEVNAVLLAGKNTQGSTLYVYPSFDIPNVCHECAKVVIQSGVKRVVSFSPSPENKERAKRWSDSIDIARVMLTEAGIEIVEVEP